MRNLFLLVSLMLFVVLALDFSPSSLSSLYVSAPSGASTTHEVANEVVVEEKSAARAKPSPPVRTIAEPPAPEPEPTPPPSQSTPQTAPKKSDTSIAADIEAEVLRLSNIERDTKGLAAVSADTTLAATARAHSADMLERDFFSHDNPDGCSSSCRATAAGYSWRMIGENIFMMKGWDLTPLEAAVMIVNGWMGSPGHRENLLKDGYAESGIGVIVEGEAIYATALYGTPR